MRIAPNLTYEQKLTDLAELVEENRQQSYFLSQVGAISTIALGILGFNWLGSGYLVAALSTGAFSAVVYLKSLKEENLSLSLETLAAYKEQL